MTADKNSTNENEVIPDNSPSKGKTSKNNDKEKSGKVPAFIGFYRQLKTQPWILYPRVLGSHESIVAKLALTYGEVDMFIVPVDLPA